MSCRAEGGRSARCHVKSVAVWENMTWHTHIHSPVCDDDYYYQLLRALQRIIVEEVNCRTKESGTPSTLALIWHRWRISHSHDLMWPQTHTLVPFSGWAPSLFTAAMLWILMPRGYSEPLLNLSSTTMICRNLGNSSKMLCVSKYRQTKTLVHAFNWHNVKYFRTKYNIYIYISFVKSNGSRSG